MRGGNQRSSDRDEINTLHWRILTIVMKEEEEEGTITFSALVLDGLSTAEIK